MFSETYTRRTKTGRMTLVRKGKRKWNRGVFDNKYLSFIGLTTVAPLAAVGVGAALLAKGKRPSVVAEVAKKIDPIKTQVAGIAAKKNAADVLEAAQKKASQNIGSTEAVKKKLNDPNHTWEFNRWG